MYLFKIKNKNTFSITYGKIKNFINLVFRKIGIEMIIVT